MNYISESFLNECIGEDNVLLENKVYALINKVQVVSKNEFVRNTELCDIIVSNRKESPNRFVKMRSNIMKFFQRSPYVSSKMVTYNNKVVGFGVSPSDRKKYDVSKYDITNFSKELESAILLRYQKLTPKKAKDILEFVEENYRDATYNIGKLYQTAVSHTFGLWKSHDTDFSSLKDKKIFCSTFIAVSYMSQGINLAPGKNPMDIWPADLLKSDMLTPICRFDINERT